MGKSDGDGNEHSLFHTSIRYEVITKMSALVRVGDWRTESEGGVGDK